jgi:hypothetical protein
LERMQSLIVGGMKPHAAAVKVARECWRSVSRSDRAAVQWLKDNQRKFRDELDPIFALEKEFEAWRLERLKKLSPRERERYEREQKQRLRERDEARKAALNRDHPKEAAERTEKRRRAAEARERKIERWHEWFKDDPKAALAQLLDEIKRDEEAFDTEDFSTNTATTFQHFLPKSAKPASSFLQNKKGIIVSVSTGTHYA